MQAPREVSVGVLRWLWPASKASCSDLKFAIKIINQLQLKSKQKQKTKQPLAGIILFEAPVTTIKLAFQLG